MYGENTGGGYGIVGVTNSGSGYAAVSGSNSGSGRGVYGGSAAGVGVFGHSGSSSDAGVSGSNDSAGPGVYGYSNTGPGVYGHSLYDDQAGVYGRHDFYGYGVFGESAGGPGVYGLSYSSSDAGVYGKNTSGSGVAGASSSSSEAGVTGSNDSTGPGVYGTSAGNYGVRGEGDGGGVYGRSTGDISAGVHGESNYGPGVEGYSVLDQGVHGESDEGIGVYGASPIGYGVYGDSSDGYAGYFAGDVHVEGELTKLAGSFKIDHPLDPQNRYLSHSFVESPDMMNIYNGNTMLDGDGAAWVELPAWFEALNGGEEHRSEFRYQLTPIGAPGPNLYIAAEIADNRFRIAGGMPGMKVSWQVTAIRHDPYAETHRIPVEEAKPAEERGTCLYPEACCRPAPAGLGDMVQPPGGAE